MLARFAPTLNLPLGAGGAVEFSPTSLEDLHPDQLYEKLEIFAELNSLRRRLASAKTFKSAADEVLADKNDYLSAVLAQERLDIEARTPLDRPLDVLVQHLVTVALGGTALNPFTVALDTDRVLFKELTIHGVYSQGRAAYEQALRLLTENRHDLGRLHTHRFPLEGAAEAIMTLGGEIAGREAICVALVP